MYDAREKAIRDLQSAINASRTEGKLEGKLEERIGHIRSLQSIMQLTVSRELDLLALSLEQLELLTAELQLRIRNRFSS